jgi:hypothetical protein
MYHQWPHGVYIAGRWKQIIFGADNYDQPAWQEIYAFTDFNHGGANACRMYEPAAVARKEPTRAAAGRQEPVYKK